MPIRPALLPAASVGFGRQSYGYARPQSAFGGRYGGGDFPWRPAHLI
nr:MAG TPA: hypothetical protein [Caudoviricetes sp.]